jgi:ubiquinone/menaquinone biosynthesis C-methylase UbiE
MSSIEEVYTHGHHPFVVAAHAERTAAEAAAFLLPRLEPGKQVLDIGCGPGSITIGLAEHVGASGSVVGIDNSAETIDVATSTHVAVPNVTFEIASAYSLPFPDASFDVAYGHQVLQHLADPIGALREVNRILRPGGLVAVREADYGTMTHHPRYPEITSWLELYHQVARANGGEPDAGRRLHQWLRGAGFRDLEVTSSVWTYSTPADRTSWAELWARRITLPHFADRAVELDLCEYMETTALAAGWRRWASEPDGWFAFIHGQVVGVKPGR